MFEPKGPMTRSQLRVFSACCVVLGSVLAWPAIREAAWPPDHTVQWVGVVFALVGSLGLLLPPAVRPVYRGAMVVTRPIGFVVAQILLAVLYFVVLTPIALVLRIFGHDPLQRRPPGHWRPATQDVDLRRAFRQY